MAFNDSFPVTTVQVDAPNTGAATKEELVIDFEQLFFPEVFLYSR
jgi:hypothetical protein